MWILLYRFHRIHLAGKTLLDYTNLFFPDDYKENDKITYKYFKNKYARRSKSRVLSLKLMKQEIIF